MKSTIPDAFPLPGEDPTRKVFVVTSTEDLHHYEGRVDLVKLATRLHERPHVVIGAYARGRYAGNLLDLMEPGFSPLLAPHVVDNARFPADWFQTVSTCDRRCHRCGYCASVLERALVELR